MYNIADKKIKYLVGGGIVSFILIIIISIIFIINRAMYSATVHILVVPSSASIVIDGKGGYANGDSLIQPGEHTAIISHEAFESQEIKFTTKENETTSLVLNLTLKEGNENWYKEHPEDGEMLDAVYDYYNVQKQQTLISENPIINILPFTVEYYYSNYTKYIKYTVSYEIAGDAIKLIIYDYTGNNYDNAINALKEKGFDVGRYKIDYIDKSNELKM